MSNKLYGYIKKDLDKYAKIDEITTDSGNGGVTDMGVPTAPTLTPITTEINFLQINDNNFYRSLNTEISMDYYVNSETGVIDCSANDIQIDNGKYGIGVGLYIAYTSEATERQKEEFFDSLSRNYQGGFITNNGSGDVAHAIIRPMSVYDGSQLTYHLTSILNYSSTELFTTSVQNGSLKLSADILAIADSPLVSDIFIDVYAVRRNPLVKTITNADNDNVALIGVLNTASDGVAKASNTENRFVIRVDPTDNTKINIELWQPSINDKIVQNIPSNTFLLYSLY